MERTPRDAFPGGGARDGRHLSSAVAADAGHDLRSFYLDDSLYDDRRTMQAWEDFLGRGGGGGRVPVRRLIHESWSRSASGGIDADGLEAPVLLDRDDVERLTVPSAELLSAARRPFGTIGRMLEGTGAMLVLADRGGAIIEVVGDRKIRHDGQDINLSAGGRWNEEAVGTNGIGTALWTGEPVVVHAAEHFCAGIKSWTCAGAPVRDPFDGSIMGVVDLSGHPSIFKPHNIALVMATAREIEKILEDNQREERAGLLEAFINLAPRYQGADGLLILNERGRIIHANNVSRRIVDEIASSPVDGADGMPQLDLARIERALAACEGAGAPRDLQVSRLALANGRRGMALVFPADARTRRLPPGGAPRGTLAAPAVIGERPAIPIVGRSEALLAVVDQALAVARAPISTALLVEGETGVGKELFARLVHDQGAATSSGPFVALNCGAVTRELFGGELFGHAPGAFTGASREGKAGVFERAGGGTLSLDEIGEMPLDIQPYLLRLLEERVVRRLGESRERPVEARLIASTNRDLKAESEAGRFRSDLFYRISAVSIRVPPLRERREDVPLLVDHFSARFARAAGCERLALDDAVMERLLAHSWPGNVRELRNLVDRLHVLAPNRHIDLRDLPSEFHDRPDRGGAAEPGTRRGAGWGESGPGEGAAGGAGREEGGPAVSSFAEAEGEALRRALAAEGGNLSKVARRLGISRPTLYRKLDQHGISRRFV